VEYPFKALKAQEPQEPNLNILVKRINSKNLKCPLVERPIHFQQKGAGRHANWPVGTSINLSVKLFHLCYQTADNRENKLDNTNRKYP